ncbi:hypothetical protein GZ77_23125 [Endozoicomonas montiporae]|uniref:Uncharacterized protein n=1 Tax=Endozoicomonas montiporae TaxID=1027273 RepID=A0A081N0L6_9GAMM|nr:hypothetical protein GZ77_23125 [Endozoicomonas montiporae]
MGCVPLFLLAFSQLSNELLRIQSSKLSRDKPKKRLKDEEVKAGCAITFMAQPFMGECNAY